MQNENSVQPPTKKALELRQIAGLFLIIAAALSVAFPIIINLPFLEVLFDIYEILRITMIAYDSMYIIAGLMIFLSKWKVGLDKIAGLLIMLAGVALVAAQVLFWIEHGIRDLYGYDMPLVALDVAEEICRPAFGGLILASGIVFLARVETRKTDVIGKLLVVYGSFAIANNVVMMIYDSFHFSAILIIGVIAGYGLLASFPGVIIAGIMLMLDSPTQNK